MNKFCSVTEGVFLLGKFLLNHSVVFFVVANLLGDMGFQVGIVKGDHFNANKSLNLIWAFEGAVLVEVLQLNGVASVW